MPQRLTVFRWRIGFETDLVHALGNPLGCDLTGGEAHELVGADHRHLADARPLAERGDRGRDQSCSPLLTA